MSDTDFSPSSVEITSASLHGTVATLAARNADGEQFTVSLNVGPFLGAKRWFFETIDQFLTIHEVPYVLTSVYDAERDEWFTTAGNYGIHSRDLHFTEASRFDRTGS